MLPVPSQLIVCISLSRGIYRGIYNFSDKYIQDILLTRTFPSQFTHGRSFLCVRVSTTHVFSSAIAPKCHRADKSRRLGSVNLTVKRSRILKYRNGWPHLGTSAANVIAPAGAAAAAANENVAAGITAAVVSVDVLVTVIKDVHVAV